MKRIETITIKRMADIDPDLSYLGSFSQKAESEYSINHRERSHERNAYTWFNPVIENYKTYKTARTIRKYCEQDYERMCGYPDQWWMIGISADAKIIIDNTIQHISSGGLWGIESDSGENYFKEIAAEQLGELRKQLSELGFAPDEIETAIDNADEVTE